MRRNRGIDTDPGWINRKLARLEQQMKEDRAARRLEGSTFPAGSVPTTALAAPVAPGFVQLSASNFATTTAGSYLITQTVTVPSGMKSCVVSLTGRVYAINSGLSTDYLLARVEVDAVNATAVPIGAGSSAGAFNVTTLTRVVSGYQTGETFTVKLWAQTSGAAWSASASNVADLSGTLSWFS